MLALVTHILASYALWFGLTQSNLPVIGNARDFIAEGWEGFARFVLCPICSGFWCSVAVAVAQPLLTHVAWTNQLLLDTAKLGLVGAAGVFLIELHVRRLERN